MKYTPDYPKTLTFCSIRIRRLIDLGPASLDLLGSSCVAIPPRGSADTQGKVPPKSYTPDHLQWIGGSDCLAKENKSGIIEGP
jgi:hypothetical protein